MLSFVDESGRKVHSEGSSTQLPNRAARASTPCHISYKVFASLAPKHDRARFRHAACGGDDLLLCINDIGQADGPAILDLVLYGLRRAAGHVAEDFRFQQLVAALQRHHQNIVLDRSEEHTSELQSLMRRSYAVFCLKKKN